MRANLPAVEIPSGLQPICSIGQVAFQQYGTSRVLLAANSHSPTMRTG